MKYKTYKFLIFFGIGVMISSVASLKDILGSLFFAIGCGMTIGSIYGLIIKLYKKIEEIEKKLENMNENDKSR